MDYLANIPLPEATEDRVEWPPANWEKRYYNLYDGFRAQTSEMKQRIIIQGVRDGNVHYIQYRGGWEPDVNFYLHYHEHGNFFSEWPLNTRTGETNAAHWLYFSNKGAAKAHGLKFLPEDPKTQG
jgi:hypothetical protein